MADEFKQHLSDRQEANGHTLKACDRLAEVTRRLARMAQEEIDGTDLSDDDVEFCHRIGRSLGGIPGALLSQASQSRDMFTFEETRPQPIAVVADVATDPNNDQVLEVAVELYALIPFYGKTYIAVGGCFSYYEFPKPVYERMTDEERRALDPKPPMPKWTRSLVRK